MAHADFFRGSAIRFLRGGGDRDGSVFAGRNVRRITLAAILRP